MEKSETEKLKISEEKSEKSKEESETKPKGEDKVEESEVVGRLEHLDKEL